MSDDDITVEAFCRRYVEPMGEESDHVHIVSLTDALLVSLLGLFQLKYAARWAGFLYPICTFTSLKSVDLLGPDIQGFLAKM